MVHSFPDGLSTSRILRPKRWELSDGVLRRLNSTLFSPETRAVKQMLLRMGQYYQNEAAHAPDRHAERQRKLKRFNRYPEQAA